MNEGKLEFPPDSKIVLEERGGKPQITARIKARNKEEFKSWLKEYQDMNKLTFRVQRGKRSGGKYIVYKISLSKNFDPT